MAILVNGRLTASFSTSRGIRQGCPLSPYLFTIAAEGLSAILCWMHQNGLIEGYLVDGRRIFITSQLFADDLILIGKTSLSKVLSWDQGLKVYTEVAGQELNKQKSTLFITGIKNHLKSYIADFFQIPLVSKDYLINYLGILISVWHEGRKTIFWSNKWVGPDHIPFSQRIEFWRLREPCVFLGLTNVVDFFYFNNNIWKPISTLLADNNGFVDYHILKAANKLNEELSQIDLKLENTTLPKTEGLRYGSKAFIFESKRLYESIHERIINPRMRPYPIRWHWIWWRLSQNKHNHIHWRALWKSILEIFGIECEDILLDEDSSLVHPFFIDRSWEGSYQWFSNEAPTQIIWRIVFKTTLYTIWTTQMQALFNSQTVMPLLSSSSPLSWSLRQGQDQLKYLPTANVTTTLDFDAAACAQQIPQQQTFYNAHSFGKWSSGIAEIMGRTSIVALAAAALCFVDPALAFKGGGPYGAEVTRGADLSGKDFSGKNLVQQDFKTSILRQANFKGAKLLGASFFDADLTAWSSTKKASWNTLLYCPVLFLEYPSQLEL
eukprot:Gb_39626 [translate_table: standard]